MFSKLKKRIDDYLNKKFSKLLKEQKLSQQEQFSYSQISKLFDSSHFIPMTTWTISPSTILHVLNDIDINQRQCIVEFGSGASTFYIAKYLKTTGCKSKFFSVESNQAWLDKLQKQIDVFELQDYVTLIYAPIEKVPAEFAFKTQETWYDTAVLNQLIKKVDAIDLILVDGSFGGGTAFSRYSAIPFLKNKLASDYSIFLDDAKRPDETEIVNEWKVLLNCNTTHFERYTQFNLNSGFVSVPFKL